MATANQIHKQTLLNHLFDHQKHNINPQDLLTKYIGTFQSIANDLAAGGANAAFLQGVLGGLQGNSQTKFDVMTNHIQNSGVNMGGTTNVCTIPKAFTSTSITAVIDGVQATGNDFGKVVTAHADLNNDGKDDLIVSDPTFNGGVGQVFIFYGGTVPSTTIQASNADVIITNTGATGLGNDIATGDLNGDGIPDLVIGHEGYDSNSGRVHVIYGGASIPSTIDANNPGANGFFMDTSSFPDPRKHGSSVAVCNVNGDQYPDLVVGVSDSFSGLGVINIFYGTGAGFNPSMSSEDVRITSQTAINNHIGSLVRCGDLNHDGYDDVLFTEGNKGVFIMFGSASITPSNVYTIDNPHVSPGDYQNLIAINQESPTSNFDISSIRPLRNVDLVIFN